MTQASIPDYDRVRHAILRTLRKAAIEGNDPKEVARLILNVAHANSPRLRYGVGGEAYWLPYLKTVLPQRLFDYLLRKVLACEVLQTLLLWENKLFASLRPPWIDTHADNAFPVHVLKAHPMNCCETGRISFSVSFQPASNADSCLGHVSNHVDQTPLFETSGGFWRSPAHRWSYSIL